MSMVLQPFPVHFSHIFYDLNAQGIAAEPRS
jgi:hypothetical protein